MTDPVFLIEPDRLGAEGQLPAVGSVVSLDGAEGHHAATVRRIGVGERVVLADGSGRAVAGEVRATTRTGLDVVVSHHRRWTDPPRTVTAVQALAKGDRSELAVETMTELGVHRIVPWQASRSIARWRDAGGGSGPSRAEKSRVRWQHTVREATKQSRRLRVPVVEAVHDTTAVTRLLTGAAAGFVLHESATEPLTAAAIPAAGEIVMIIGPEGGIAEDELADFTAAGGRPVLLSDGVLRSSTAGAAALAQLAVLTWSSSGTDA